MTKTSAPATATCRRCRATLTGARAVAKGIGAVCARRERQEKAAKSAGFKPAQIVKAKELIADGGIVPIRGRRVFQVVASNGTGRYLTAEQGCTCPAGVRGKHVCYHRVAAALLAA